MKKCFVIVGIWPRRCASMRVNLTLWRCATMRIQRQCATMRFHLTWWVVLDFMQSIFLHRGAEMLRIVPDSSSTTSALISIIHLRSLPLGMCLP